MAPRVGDYGFTGRSGISGLTPMNAPRNDNVRGDERMREALRVIAALTVAEEGESYESLLALIDAARQTAAQALREVAP